MASLQKLAGLLASALAFSLVGGARLRGDIQHHSHPNRTARALILETSGSLIINEDGDENVYYLSQDVGDGDKVPKTPMFLDGGKGVKIPFDSRFYIMTKPGMRSSPNREDFKMVALMDKTLKYTIDLNGAGCGCNAAFYTISMPHAGPGANNDWYCDANNVGGQACPEFDLTEANTHAKISVAHGCASPWTEENCDKWGHGWKDHNEAFKRGAVTVEHTFTWTQVTTKISQGSWSETKTLTGLNTQFGQPHLEGSSNGMSEALRDGQVLALSFWGSDDLSWLDGCPRPYSGPGTFQGYGNPDSCVPFYTISDITLETNSAGSPAPTAAPVAPTPIQTPAPTPVGDECANAWQQCGGNGWTGATCCMAGLKCHPSGEWYSQCVPGSATP